MIQYFQRAQFTILSNSERGLCIYSDEDYTDTRYDLTVMQAARLELEMKAAIERVLHPQPVPSFDLGQHLLDTATAMNRFTREQLAVAPQTEAVQP